MKNKMYFVYMSIMAFVGMGLIIYGATAQTPHYPLNNTYNPSTPTSTQYAPVIIGTTVIRFGDCFADDAKGDQYYTPNWWCRVLEDVVIVDGKLVEDEWEDPVVPSTSTPTATNTPIVPTITGTPSPTLEPTNTPTHTATATSTSTTTPEPTDTVSPDPTKKPHCNNGSGEGSDGDHTDGDGAEGCDATDNPKANDDETAPEPVTSIMWLPIAMVALKKGLPHSERGQTEIAWIIIFVILCFLVFGCTFLACGLGWVKQC